MYLPTHYYITKNLCVLKQTHLLYLSFVENFPRIEELDANLYKGLSASEKGGDRHNNLEDQCVQ